MTKLDHLTRLEIVKLYRERRTPASIVRHFQEMGKQFSRQTIEYHLKKFKNGDFDDRCMPDTSLKQSVKFKSITNSDLEFIKQSLEEQPTQSAHDIQRSLQKRGLSVSCTTARKAISEAGYTHSSAGYCQTVHLRDANKGPTAENKSSKKTKYAEEKKKSENDIKNDNKKSKKEEKSKKSSKDTEHKNSKSDKKAKKEEL